MVRRLAAAGAAVLLGALSLMAGSVPAHAAEAARGWVVYVQHTGWCIGPQNGSTANRALIVQASPSCGPFEWTSSPSGWYFIRNLASGKCLAVVGASKLNGAQIMQYDCVNTPNSEWVMIKKDPRGGVDWYQWRNRNSGKCLNVPNSSRAAGAVLIQYTCNDTASNNLFTWEPA